ncbi:MAG: hypothetical protein HZB53_14000 [Chloroflexi bacterium]|nr:hypothetical protein [Chloroflexota bacterium]
MGHVARVFEAAGIPTVIAGLRAFRVRLTAMRVPRLLLTPNVLGQTLGAPHDVAGQRAVLRAALTLLEEAPAGGTVTEM